MVAATPETNCSDVNSGIILMHCRLIMKNLVSQGMEVWFSLNIKTDLCKQFCSEIMNIIMADDGKNHCVDNLKHG